jgi:hypothetical protein
LTYIKRDTRSYLIPSLTLAAATSTIVPPRTFTMMSSTGGHATPSPSPLPPIDNSNKFDDKSEDSADDVINAAMNTELMVDEEKGAEEERAAHTAFDAEQQHHREAATAEEESDDDDGIDWSGPGPEEKATE